MMNQKYKPCLTKQLRLHVVSKGRRYIFQGYDGTTIRKETGEKTGT